MVTVTLQINGQSATCDIAPGLSLLTLLRDLGWVGVHRTCESGDCGACTVWVEGKAIHSCLYPAVRGQDRQITTIEGLAPGDQLHPLQQALLEGQGFQCGFCTPGLIMSAAQIENIQDLPEGELRSLLRGNLCRCTGYQAIIESLQGQIKTCSSQIADPVGQSVPKQDGPTLVTGKPAYTGDWSIPDQLHLKVLRSPHAHARIRQIDIAKAKALPGVHAILTHTDVPRRPYTTAGHAEPVPDPLDHYLLDEKVRFVGDRVAAVVADSVAIALQACDLIEVDYEILPHAIEPQQALTGEVVIHDEPESTGIWDRDHNIASQVELGMGDLDQGFAEADLIIENVYDLPTVQHAQLEPHISQSWIDEQGQLVIRSSTQVPFLCQERLAQILDFPQEQIRVFKPQLGGGFGNKQEIWTEDLCALATLKTGRPVQWELTREEEFMASNTRHPMQIRMKTGVTQAGILTAQQIEVIANTGAYGNHGQTVVFLSGYMPLALYRCPHKRFLGRAIYTNTNPAGAFRGYGATQGTFALEVQMDEIAETLGLDPIELRRKNLIAPGDRLAIGRMEDHFNLIGSYGLDECLDRVMQALRYVPGDPPQVEGNKRRGRGLSISAQGSGLAKIHAAGVKLSLQPTGRFLLCSGSVDVGTGSDTTLRQIAAQVLGVRVSDIDLITADTHRTPFDAGSFASATLYISGQAVNRVAQQLRDQLIHQAAQILNATGTGKTTPEGIQFPTGSIPWVDLAQKAAGSLEVELEHRADESTLTFAVQGVEVEVDTETGQIRVLRCVQAVDLGVAVNPRICEGQALGGTAMGIGYALSEELIRDDQGRILNPGFRFYRIPTAMTLPQVEVMLIQKADPYGPMGAKGVGEITTNGAAPAIANAVAHATGIRLRQLPMTPERVWRALQDRQD